MGLEAVVNEIREKGRREVESIRAETRVEVEKILKEAQDHAAAIKIAAQEEVERTASHIVNQETSAANLAVKRLLLNAQKDVLDQVYSTSLAAVGELPAEFQEKALTSLLKRAAKEVREGVVHANERDLQLVREIISRHKDFSGYTVGSPVEIPGGIIVESKDGDLQIDYSYRTLLEEVWESCLKDVSEILFK
ncbi:V-type ATP synthase subunit E family protein [Methanoculleus sp.]|jgi:V/A-type H+-transporting ATPase subunit E|uniref:V-type ATP synthase subunit E family protein n=1 Tax=Methanoculleus sp. TaxID=90427 RepID=UPI00262F66F2|nr:V-type ATP synthase subunit E family protein [Methanoculleus sp.]MDI6867031.1 V-type ATP synthase subunit E family protein [Methanoculleus sp.]